MNILLVVAVVSVIASATILIANVALKDTDNNLKRSQNRHWNTKEWPASDFESFREDVFNKIVFQELKETGSVSALTLEKAYEYALLEALEEGDDKALNNLISQVS